MSKQCTVRLTEDGRAALRELSESQGLTPGAAAGAAVRRLAVERGLINETTARVSERISVSLPAGLREALAESGSTVTAFLREAIGVER